MRVMCLGNGAIRVRCCVSTWVTTEYVILTSHWSKGTAHSEFSWLESGTNERTAALKGRSAHVKPEASIILVHSCRQDTFILNQPLPIKSIWVFFSCRNPQFQQPPSTSQLLLWQMGAEGHKTPNMSTLTLFHIYISYKTGSLPAPKTDLNCPDFDISLSYQIGTSLWEIFPCFLTHK